MSVPSIPRSRAFVALLVIAAALSIAGPGRSQGNWPPLNVRGVALRPPLFYDERDTVLSLYTNNDRIVSLVWDRDSVAEARSDFGGYAVYRAIGPDTAHMTLLRRYVKRPEEKYGNSNANPDNGSLSRYWTWLDNPSPSTGKSRRFMGLFTDPDSIPIYDRILTQIGIDPSGLGIFDTLYVRRSSREVNPYGPKNGFEYYYAVTIHDTTDNANDLTPRSAGLVGPLIPTGAVVVSNLDRVKAVPNPYTFRADWDLADRRKIRFVNLPSNVKIEIYSADGARVRVLEHTNSLDNGEDWDLKNGEGIEVGAGMYLFRVETPDGRERVSRFTVIR